MRKIPFVVLAAVLTAMPASLAGQVSVGVGAGVSLVSEQGGGLSAVRPQVTGRFGFGMARGGEPMMEGTVYGLGDEEPRASDYQSGELVRRPEILRTALLLLSAQVDLGQDLYLRPGLGVGFHTFPSYLVGPGDVVQSVDTSREGGLAVGLAAGRTFGLSRGVGVAVEGVGAWSQGEDSTNARYVVGLQVVPTWRP